MTLKRLTEKQVRDRFPGAVEEWISDVLLTHPDLYADERSVLLEAVFWDDSGTLVLGWQVEGKANYSLNKWVSKSLEWAMDVDTLEFHQNFVVNQTTRLG